MKAQLNISLVLFGIIAIVALVGLILLFTRPGANPYNIGDIYGPGRGIAPLTHLPPYTPGAPTPQFPAGPSYTIGTRTPFMVFFRGEYGNIADMGKCWADLVTLMAAPQDAFSCYAVPTSGPAYEVTGFFWPTSSALPKPLYQLGGDIYCYERYPYNRDALSSHLKPTLEQDGWRTDVINGQDVLVCSKGAVFQFPQGMPIG